MSKLTNRIIGLVLALAMIASFVLVPSPMDIKADAATVSSTKLCDYIQDGVTLHCWNWSVANVKANLGLIANMGYSAVQLSPMQELKEGTVNKPYDNWWAVYQPISFNINESASHCVGTKAELIDLCKEAHKYGIKVIMDVVFNHMANNGSNTLCPLIDPDFLNDASCWHDYSQNSSHYNDRYDVTQRCMAGLPDINTGNQKVQDKALALMKEYIDCGVDGFRFDAAKQIETPDDHSSYASDFWPTVVGGASDYAASTRGIMLHFYGELLQDTDNYGSLPISAYTKYMSATESVWSNDIRYKMEAHNASALRKAYFKDAPADKLVLWAESHDTVGDGSSLYSSQYTLDKAWALAASRAYTMGLYFPRCLNITDLPLDMGVADAKAVNQEMGEIVKLGWTSELTKAVNRFHNHFAGQSEYLSQDTSANLYYNERGNSGVIITNFNDGGRDINLPVYAMASGTYYDQITGNKFTVSGGRIYGSMGDSGVAVVYNPGTTTCNHSSHGLDGYCYSCYTYVGHKSGTSCSTCGTASTRTIYFKNTDGWSNVYIYGWHDSAGEATASWPGTKMTLVEGDTYQATIPATATNIIFNNNSGTQTANLVPSADNDTYDMATGFWSTRGRVDMADNYYLFYTTNAGAYNGYDYRFVDGKTTVTFDETSYVWVIDSNGVQYMTDGWQGEVTSVTLKTLESITGTPDKLVVPHSKALTFTMSLNADGTMNLSYAEGGSSSGGNTGSGDSGNTGTTTTKTIYFDNSTKKWSKVNVYAWDDATGNYTGEWPGTAMTSIGNNIYSYEVPTGATKIIFNNGTSQTSDLTIPTGSKNLYTPSTSAWSVYTADSGSGDSGNTGTTTTKTIYFDNSTKKWSKVNVYAWDDATGNYTGEWPGTAMTSVGNNIYSYEVPTGATKIIFNDGTSQTSDLTIPTSSKNLYTPSTSAWSVYTPGSGGSTGGDSGTTGGNVTDNLYYLFWGNSSGSLSHNEWDTPFVGGKLTVTFDETMYVWVISKDGGIQYMTNGWQGNVNSVKLYKQTELTEPNKLVVPAGTQTLTLSDNGDGSLTLAYGAGNAGNTGGNTGSGDSGNTGTTTTKTIYFDNSSKNWSKVNAYSWNDSGACTGEWPGTAMSSIGNNIYSIQVPTTATSIIFNDGTSQTGDLTIPTDSKNLCNGTTWSTYTADAGDGEYRLVTSLSDITSGGEFIIAVKNGSTYRALSQTMSGMTIASTSVSVNGDVASGAPVFTIKPATGGVLFNVNGADISFGGSPAVLVIAKGTNGFTVTSKDMPSYGILYNIPNDQFMITTVSNATSVNYIAEALFFKYTEAAAECSHSYTSKVTTAATCTANGVKTFTCSKCGDSYTETIAATGHSYANGACSTCGAKDPNYVVTDAGYYLVTDISQITSGGKFVIVANNSGTYQAMNTTLSSGKFTGTTVTVSGNAVTGTSLPVWTIESVSGGVALMVDGAYLSYKSSTNFTTSSSSYTWTVTEGSTGYILNSSATSRGIYFQKSTSKFGAYSTSYANSSSYISNLQLYKYQAGAECSHSYTSKVTTAATCTAAGVKTFTCSKCGDSYTETIAALGHSYTGGTCTTCGAADPNYVAPDYYLFGYINGADYGCGDDLANLGSYKFVNGKVTVRFTEDSYVAVKTSDNATFYMTNGWVGEATSATLYAFTDPNSTSANKLLVSGGQTVTFTLTENWDGNLLISYTVDSQDCVHSSHNTDGICSTCGAAVEHTYSLGVCTVCGAQDPDYSGYVYYLFGYINGANYGCEEDYTNLGEYKFVDGKLTTTFINDSYVGVKEVNPGAKFGPEVVAWYMTDGWQGEVTSATLYDSTTLSSADKLFVPGSISVTFTMVKNEDGTVSLSYSTEGEVCNHSYSSKVTTAATCTTNGVKTYTCTGCGVTYTEVIPATGHSYANGYCTTCGSKDPTVSGETYYLFGYINGANYACEEDYENMGQYKFVNGKLTVTFTEDSYVGVKTEGNIKWFMTDGWQGTDKTYVTLYDSTTLFNSDKFYVPGNAQVTFSLIENADGTLALSYSITDTEPSVVPTLALKYPTVSFEDVIVMNVYYTAADLEDVVEMGLITYSSNVSEWNINNAEGVVPGYSYDSAKQMYVSSTKGIAGKNLGDTLYFAVYAKLADGTYTYTKLVSYSPETYAYSQLSSGTAEIKALVVAMLKYGAAAQTFFGHNTDALIDRNLTSAQKALVDNYRADMMASVSAPSTAKQGAFVATGGHVSRYPTISFEGAFSINYYYTPSYQPVDGITMYYWNQADYDAVNVLTAANATGAIKMAGSGTSRYEAAVEDIAAKDLDKGIYVAFIYSDGNNSYASGVLSYSIGAYCTTSAAGTGAVAPLAAATAVYGYYAKQAFYK